MLQQNHPNRFKPEHRVKHACTKLLHNGSLVTGTKELLSCWANHFASLGKSQCVSNEHLKKIQSRLSALECASLNESDSVLDSEILVDEVVFAINHLKRNRAGGPDAVSPEHLKFCGSLFKKWLCNIFNHICQLECIPLFFKKGIIIPVFKGKGKDPLLMENYRGITLTSVFAKVFEIILAERIKPILEERNIPQETQTAYRSGHSSRDSIFAGLEAVEKFTSEGDNVYTCFFDLTAAFDTVEFCVLLDHLFGAGIKGKCWRLIRHWYRDVNSTVQVCKHQSAPFNLERGIRQGSVLSPSIFNLVIDPLLKKLKDRSLGLSINGLFLGAFAHADDIRTLATNHDDSAQQASIVHNYTKQKGLQLSIEKCALVPARSSPALPDVSIGPSHLPTASSMKCLGVWWNTATHSKQSVEERICKARAAFFAHGQLGAFHGSLNPLSSRSIVESCVLPVLMYGSESWILNASLLQALESFQAELGKRILILSKFTANNIPLLVLKWPSMCARLLCSKLSFLHHVCNGSSSLSTQVFRSLATSDASSVSLIKQCKFLDTSLGSDFTNELLSDHSMSIRDLKKRIITFDHNKTVESAKDHSSQLHVALVESSNAWMKFWDIALDHGTDGTRAATTILKTMCRTVFADRKCPMDSCEFILPENSPLCDHLISHHFRIPPELSVSSSSDLSDLVISTASNPAQFSNVISVSHALLNPG